MKERMTGLLALLLVLVLAACQQNLPEFSPPDEQHASDELSTAQDRTYLQTITEGCRLEGEIVEEIDVNGFSWRALEIRPVDCPVSTHTIGTHEYEAGPGLFYELRRFTPDGQATMPITGYLWGGSQPKRYNIGWALEGGLYQRPYGEDFSLAGVFWKR